MYKCLIYIPGRKLPKVKWVREKKKSFKLDEHLFTINKRNAVYRTRFYKLVFFFMVEIKPLTNVTWEKEYEPTR